MKCKIYKEALQSYVRDYFTRLETAYFFLAASSHTITLSQMT